MANPTLSRRVAKVIDKISKVLTITERATFVQRISKAITFEDLDKDDQDLIIKAEGTKQ